MSGCVAPHLNQDCTAPISAACLSIRFHLSSINTHRRKPMFTELMPLLRKRRLLLTISLIEGDTIRATVVPQKASDTEDNSLTTPLAITGTAEELDRDLPQQLVEFTGAHL